ncbi:HAD family hydrolase [Occultella glacieicola]|uniref:HAD family hydrolase n=1 Tax=Occultella glacieicola TaxID=2518684 RepID=A0ABY2E128_9MICO|nr:HAD-IC family P-type ATPase [Occultella glacieicola]TDE88922.1 HAD family hydrolase [Occultella glacieicola]
MSTPPRTNTTDPGRGLSAADVAARVARGEVNVAPESSSRSLAAIIRGNLFTLFNAILGTALVVVLLVGSWQDAVFGFVLLSNALIGGLTEYRAKRTLDRLAILDAPNATVLRDGAEQVVDLHEIVTDDVLLLRLGDQVPADGEVLSSRGAEIDESMLTGESEPVGKRPGDEVLSGSAVVAGSAVVRATRVGTEGYANRLTAQVRRFSLVNSELRSGINRILVYVSWAIVPIAALLVWSQIRHHGGLDLALADGTWRGAVVSAVAGVVGMVPEGLVLLTSINFALAAIVLARRKVLVQELPAVEVLARVDVLCLDKTGTLTDGTVGLSELIELTPTPGARAALAALAADPDANASAAAIAPGVADVPAPAAQVLVPFSSARKWSALSTGEGTWVFGAPEVLLDPDDGVLARVHELADTGARVLVLAAAPADAPTAPTVAGEAPPRDLRPAYLVVLREHVRPDAAQTLAYFAAQGVTVKVISGDNPATVAAIAGLVGLGRSGTDGSDGAVTGVDARTLPADGEELADQVTREQVFGRVTPEQKRAFVHALQSRGHTVAMTGDGVNDALALKDADLGIAMGSGAAATKAVARLVLLDGRFATLPGVVDEGRRVIANMERVASLFLNKTTYAVLLAIVVAITAWPYPFLPRHLTLVGALTIGTPAFFLALAPTRQRYVPGFLPRVLSLSIPCGIASAVAVLVVYGTLHARDAGLQANTGATLTLVIMGLWLLGALARPWNWWRILLFAAMAGGAVLALAVPPVRTFFALELPEPFTAVLVAVTAGLGCLVIELAYRRRALHPGAAEVHPAAEVRYDISTSR